MSGSVKVTCSEGVLPLSDESQQVLFISSSTPWNLWYPSSSNENDCSNREFEESEGIGGKASQDDMDGKKKLVLPTPTMAVVPFRRHTPSLQDKENESICKVAQDERIIHSVSKKSKAICKKSSPKVIQASRKPLRTLFKETTVATPPPVTDSEDETLTPVSSRCSSSTSIASSISPITPIERYQKRLEEEEVVKKEKKPPEIKVDSKVEYQQLLTKYFKAKKIIRRLRDQNKYDQRKISLLEFSRQQEALLVQMAETTVPEEQQQNMSESLNVTRFVTENANNANNESAPAVLTSSDNSISTEAPPCEKENDTLENGGEMAAENKCSSKFASYHEVRDELISRMAEAVSDKSLRPIIYNVLQESPPCKMFKVIEQCSKNCCESCGRRMNQKWN